MHQSIPFHGHEAVNWSGYTLDELRYQRALNLARREMLMQQMKTVGDDIAKGYPILADQQTILEKIASSLTYVDYGIMPVTLFLKIRKLFSRKNTIS